MFGFLGPSGLQGIGSTSAEVMVCTKYGTLMNLTDGGLQYLFATPAASKTSEAFRPMSCYCKGLQNYENVKYVGPISLKYPK